MKLQQHYSAGLYCRLSVEDNNSSGTSDSIETQKLMLEQYCKENNITEYEFFCDDGCSGTNFDRPQFKRMYDKIMDGKINIVIVKDLSRFGRNYIEVGRFQKLFYDSGVRFIAINDNYDSLTCEDDFFFPLKNMFNDMYAKDISKKTKKAKQAKARAGQFIGSKAPFGYDIDPNDRHHLVIDENAAEVVRRIFRLAHEGNGSMRIAKIMRNDGVLTPSAYFNLTHPGYYESSYWLRDFDWHNTSVLSMLENEVYKGALVYNKTHVKSIKSHLKVKNDEEDWIIVPNCHEAIIPEKYWDEVQEIMKSKKHSTATGEYQMFAGLVKCADCGHALTFSQKKRRDGTYHGSFSCWLYKTHGKEYCASHYITYDSLYDIVLRSIRANIGHLKKNKERYMNALLSLGDKKIRRRLQKMSDELNSKNIRIDEINRIASRLYEDMALGRIDEQQYNEMSEKYKAEKATLTEDVQALSAKLEESDNAEKNIRKFIEIIDKYTDIKELNAPLLNELIDKIVVHHKSIGNSEKPVQHVDIYFKFIGKIQNSLGNLPISDTPPRVKIS